MKKKSSIKRSDATRAGVAKEMAQPRESKSVREARMAHAAMKMRARVSRRTPKKK
jgi:hypothetical protein